MDVLIRRAGNLALSIFIYKLLFVGFIISVYFT